MVAGVSGPEWLDEPTGPGWWWCFREYPRPWESRVELVRIGTYNDPDSWSGETALLPGLFYLPSNSADCRWSKAEPEAPNG